MRGPHYGCVCSAGVLRYDVTNNMGVVERKKVSCQGVCKASLTYPKSSFAYGKYHWHSRCTHLRAVRYCGQAILGEQDEVWVRYRHQHIQDVNQSVQEEIQLFLKENSTAKMQQNMVRHCRSKSHQVFDFLRIRVPRACFLPQNKSSVASISVPFQATTSEDTLKAIRSLPQYQEALSRVLLNDTF